MEGLPFSSTNVVRHSNDRDKPGDWANIDETNCLTCVIAVTCKQMANGKRRSAFALNFNDYPYLNESEVPKELTY